MPDHARFHLDLTKPIKPAKQKSARQADYIGSPSRIRGHNGSTNYRPKLGRKLLSIPGAKSTRKMRPESRLELLGTMLLHCESATAAFQRMKDVVRRNKIGGAEFTNTASQRMKPVTLRDIVAQIDNSRIESASMAESVACHLDSLAVGFGHYLLSVENVAIAAKLAGISKSAAYRLISTVRDSWEIFADSAT